MVKVHSSLKIKKDAKIGVLCGGMSSEREVSLRSGKNCFEALRRLGYENAEIIDVDRNIAKTLLEKGIQVAFITLHGKYGEDGCIQGLLEILGIPYTGCGVKASAVCMDKEFTKRIVKTQNIPLIPSVTFNSCSSEQILKQVQGDMITTEGILRSVQDDDLRFPIMVKPASEGSSIGMSKVCSQFELKEAVKKAEKYDSNIMLENFIEGKSVTVGVLEVDEETFATPILEFRIESGWYDFKAKYTEGMTQFILPAKLDENMTKRIQELAVKSHKAVDARGISRVDFIVTDDEAYLLEINTIPGMTDLSDLPAQAKTMGIEYDHLVEIILNSAAYRPYFNKNLLTA